VLAGTLAGGATVPILILAIWGPEGADIGEGIVIYFSGLLLGALLGAVVGARAGGFEFRDRSAVITRAGTIGAIAGLAVAILPIISPDLAAAKILIGPLAGAVGGVIIGRLWCGGRIRLWEIMLAVFLIALVCRVVAVWLPR
jgi:hypothetical protein